MRTTRAAARKRRPPRGTAAGERGFVVPNDDPEQGRVPQLVASGNARRRRTRKTPQSAAGPNWKGAVPRALLGFLAILWCSWWVVFRGGAPPEGPFMLPGELAPPALETPPPSLEDLPPERRDRFRAVQDAIRHAWRGYADRCLVPPPGGKLLGSHIACDDASPLGNAGHDWLYHAATLYDSLDTLALGLGTGSDEYREAARAVLTRDSQASSLRPTKTFEYSLRVVGGLLGAYSVTADARWLARARDAADALLQSPFRNSPTPLPRIYDVLFPPRRWWWSRPGNFLYWLYARLYQWGRDVFTDEHRYNSLAGVGSFALEFAYLSEALGDPTYHRCAERIFEHVSAHASAGGTSVPSGWNVMTGLPTGAMGGLGSGTDSFAEYLLKVPLLLCGGSDGAASSTQHDSSSSSLSEHRVLCDGDSSPPLLTNMLSLYHTMVLQPLEHGRYLVREDRSSVAYPVESGSKYHQLLCFLPGLVALGGTVRPDEDDPKGRSKVQMALAEALLGGCQEMHDKSPTGLGPEQVAVSETPNAAQPPRGDRSYLLRPEHAESLFVLYRLTGNQRYQQMGWRLFESLEEHCRLPSGGYSGLEDVYHPPNGDGGGGRVDDMPSYFLAETLKYLLLLFGPDDYVSLDDFVFTTEAHPLRKPPIRSPETKEDYGRAVAEELSLDKYAVEAPFPWLVFLVLVLVLVAVGNAVFLGCVCVFRCGSARNPKVKT